MDQIDAHPDELELMLTALEGAPAVLRPSAFWARVVDQHASEIRTNGLKLFKQTLNNSYFQMGSRSYWRALPLLLRDWSARPSLAPLRPRVHRCKALDVRTDWLLPTAIGLLYWSLRADDRERLFGRVQEPDLGCPTRFVIGNVSVTQDLCHSIGEYYAFIPRMIQKPMRNVGELGAGYGRLGFLALAAREDVRYHVIDIPPALYVSQSYLSEVFPGLPIFRFTDFRRFEDVRAEMLRSRLVFLEPQQLSLLPDDYFDGFCTISSLAEMTGAQVEEYTRQIDRLCAGVFYTKQWEVAYNPFDQVTIREGDYPVPSRWTLLMRRNAIVPRRMFERVYQCR